MNGRLQKNKTGRREIEPNLIRYQMLKRHRRDLPRKSPCLRTIARGSAQWGASG